jgi:hypothetical protein
MIRVLEELPVFTPLGIRFWDAALNRQIHDGLVVRAWPESAKGPVVTARRTASDVYTFGRLPGLLTVEYRQRELHAAAGSPDERSFVVHVQDPRGRFVSAAFVVPLPLSYSGVFPGGGTGSPPTAFPGFPLYSAATRPLSPSVAVIRGDLVHWDLSEPDRFDRPASHATVEVRGPTGESAVGVSDERGRFVVVLPYPEFDLPMDSPPEHGLALFDQHWTVTLAVRYEPSGLVPLSGTDTPDYASVLEQTVAGVWESVASPPEAGAAAMEIDVELSYGRDLVVRSHGHSSLLVSPLTSP